MTPQVMNYTHIDSCTVIGCNLVQPHRKNKHVYFRLQSHRSCIIVAVTIVNMKSHDVAWHRTVITVTSQS